jgi:putrescine---pyruvate transaminase
MAQARTAEVVLVRGDGCWVEDDAGTRYLDATAALWYCNVGHGRSELATAAAKQMTALACYQTFDVFANRPAIELADRLCALAPTAPPSAVFFTNGGSDAIDTAAKIARRYWRLRGEPERELIVARDGAYHGMNAYGTSLAGIEANAAGWGRLVGGVLHVPRDDPQSLARILDEHAGRVAAFVGEPVQGAGGVFPPKEGYWAAVQQLCREDGALVIADEVVCGFGRVGRWFASERFAIEPDILVVAKGLSSGYAPIGAVVAGRNVREVLWEGGPFRHGYTYSGHPTACAVALANLDILEREDLVARVATLEPVLSEAVGGLLEHEAVAAVRSCGLLAGVELSAAFLADSGRGIADVVRAVRERGVLVRALGAASLQISPPFVIGEGELRLLASTLADSFDAIAE